MLLYLEIKYIYINNIKMIKNLLNKIEKSLFIFNEKEIITLLSKTNTDVYTSIHKAILNINDIDTNNIINEIKEKHINEIEYKNKQIDNIKLNNINEMEMWTAMIKQCLIIIFII